MKINAYACSWPNGPCPDHETIINSISRGAAKTVFWRSVREAYQDVPFTALRVRKVGDPVTTEGFLRNARYRGIPDARCGDRVKAEGWWGRIVGHNDSANLDILFEEGPCAGQVLNVHPAGVEGWHDRVAAAMGEN